MFLLKLIKVLPTLSNQDRELKKEAAMSRIRQRA